MGYRKVLWHHDSPEGPVELFSEFDDESWEVRKVEVHADGHADYAGPGERSGTTALGEVPVPSLDEIDSDPEFTPRSITKIEFEHVWEAARSVGHPL